MKEKIIATVLVIMAVAVYTTAVINFMQGDVLKGVSDVLIACSDVIIAWVLMRQEFYAKALQVIGKHHFDLIEALEKGVPAKLTIVRKDEDEDEGDEIPEEQLTEDEKHIKRMAEEYDQLAGRLHRLQAFRDTDTYKQLPENSRYLLDKQCKAMDDYESILKQRIQIECDTENEKKEDLRMKHPKFWIYIIAAIVAAMIVACLCSCEQTRQTRTIENVSGTCFDVIVIDSCEYVIGSAGYEGYMAHKGNCKYCEQRRKR